MKPIVITPEAIAAALADANKREAELVDSVLTPDFAVAAKMCGWSEEQIERFRAHAVANLKGKP